MRFSRHRKDAEPPLRQSGDLIQPTEIPEVPPSSRGRHAMGNQALQDLDGAIAEAARRLARSPYSPRSHSDDPWGDPRYNIDSKGTHRS